MTALTTRVFNSSTTLRALMASSALLMVAVTPARADDWQWSVTPYVWATDLGANVSIPGRPAIDRTISFGDLIKDLDMTAQVHVEAQHGRNGVTFDMFSNQLSKDSQFALPQLGGASASLSSKITMTVLDAGGVFSPSAGPDGFKLLYGSRMFIQRASIDARIAPAPSVTLDEHQDFDATTIDALIGAGYSQRLFGGLSVLAHGDASTGGTRYTWTGSAGLSYAFGSSGRYAVTAGYRRMQIKLSGDGSPDTRLTLKGFASGVRVSF
jgi:hypothetical protein